MSSSRWSLAAKALVACAVSASAILALSISAAATPGVGLRAPSHRGLYAPHGAHLPFGGAQQGVCGQAGAGVGRCLIHVLSPASGAPLTRSQTTITNPTGLAPATIKAVYGYSASAEAGAGQTIAIVDAYNDPAAASDLSKFSAEYGLPAANFTQVSQTGGSSLPATNASWDLEISLDIEWAHAIAPGASILLVEASSNSLANLLAAESYAAAHADYVSNSWGSSEFSGEAADDSYFNAPGVSYFAASGDGASEMLWPSASPDVTSVGGTSLSFTSGGTLAAEAAWSEGGGGCSRYESASPSQQTGSVSCAGKRATPDVSLDANPSSGVSVYDSVAYERQSGWWTVGGTSASTVMWAAEAAASASPIGPAFLYASPASIPFRDVVTGSNGHPAGVGYDLATGLGSWSYTPGAPSGLTASRRGGEATLSWSAPSGAPVTEYAIWRGTASGAETTLLGTVPSSDTSYVDSSLNEGVTYYYEVQALNTLGNGPFSAQAQAVPPSAPPVASFSKSCSQATCSFNSTSTDASGTIATYAWNGGNGKTGSGSKFSDSYKAAGEYVVTLLVTNTAGQSSQASGVVTCSTTTTRQRSRTISTLTCK